MKFVEDINKDEYENFCNSYPDMSFMQLYEWGQFNKIVRNQTPYYLGVYVNDKLVACGCFNKKMTPLNMCYIYAPRGFLIDYNNKELLEFFTKNLKAFAKKQNAIYIKFDPEIMYQEIDDLANSIENGKNNYKAFNNLIDLGYKHGGFNKLFEKNQPRYTFRVNFNNRTWEEVEKAIPRTFRTTLNRNYFYEVEFSFSDDIKTFYSLHQTISKKDDFNEYGLKYYQEMYNVLKKSDHIVVHSAKIYPDKILKKINDEIENINNSNDQNRINRLQKDKEFFEPLKDKYPDGKIIGMSICVNTKNGTWALYIGNDNIAQYTLTVNRFYYEWTKYAHERGCKFLDLYGTVGDPKTNYKNLAGIHEYKRKFGGTYTEFMGEFDLINKPFWNFLLPKLLWFYRKTIGKIKK